MEHNTIVIGWLYSFGSKLESFGHNEEEVRKALAREHSKEYKRRYGCNPNRTIIRKRDEDIQIATVKIGQAYWC